MLGGLASLITPQAYLQSLHACMIVVTLQLGPCQPSWEYSPLSYFPKHLLVSMHVWPKLAPADKHAVPTRHNQAHPPRRAAVDVSLALVCYVFSVMSG